MKKIIKGFVLLALVLVSSSKLFAQVSIGLSVNIAPPRLPVYVQPACPADGYLWVPGYWAYDNNIGDYYWVPGVWVSPPHAHYLWTPGYWGYDGSVYSFHNGYWGRHVGFYGGVNYGYGYGGSGFGGGRWEGNSFRYNTAVVNVNKTVVRNTYVDNTVVVNNTTVNNRTSFNGRGGVSAEPKPEELSAMKEKHVQPTADQQSHQQTAMDDRSQHASANHGKPAVTAYNKVGGDKFEQKGKPAKVTMDKSDALARNDKPAPVDKHHAGRSSDNPAKPNRDLNPTPAGPKLQSHTASSTEHVKMPRAEKPARRQRPPAEHAPKEHVSKEHAPKERRER